MRMLLKRIAPRYLWMALRSFKHAMAKGFRRVMESLGLVVALKSDYYSPLPSEFELRKSLDRWSRPSSLAGVHYDLDAMRRRLSALTLRHYAEFCALGDYEKLQRLGYGPGYPQLDALVLYSMIRDIKPRRYVEVGSGLSTYYCSLARDKNAEEGHETQIICVEPFPFDQLRRILGIELIEARVQDVEAKTFMELESGDVLFIDSSHVLRIDGDVAMLFLEVLPLLRKGVRVHIHDVPFPFNTPYPPEYWVLTEDKASSHWPMYWNEAMLTQAFLSMNPHFEIEMSCPMLRHFDEGFLRQTIPFYKGVKEEPNTFSSLWLLRSGSAPGLVIGPEGTQAPTEFIQGPKQ